MAGKDDVDGFVAHSHVHLRETTGTGQAPA